MNRPVCLADWERLAAARSEPALWDFVAGGSDDEVTLRANRDAFARWQLRPRVLGGVANPDLSTTVLGQAISLPVLVAPLGLQQLAHAEGERATARGAAEARTLHVVSTMSTVAVEELEGARWFQLYLLRERERTTALVRRAEAAGCGALVVTVDAPRLGRRERDLRSGFVPPAGLRAAHLADTRLDEAAPDRSSLAAHAAREFDPAPGWDAIGWLRSLTRLPLVLKGVLTAEDARRAREEGVAALIVSNHGGRQLDGAPATLDVLGEVVDAVAGRCEVLLDGGVRRGTDVLKALGLGARAVLLGRPIWWGLTVDGAAGVRAVLEQLRDELALAMTLCGRGSLDQIDGSLLRRSER